jgi:uncharacterized protein (TIGR01777 family)
MDVLVTGSSGLIGTALVAALREAGHRPVRLVRGSASGDTVTWDPAGGTIDGPSLEGLDAVVHLAGAGIGDHRWTDSYKAEIRDSRVRGTTLLAETLAGLSRPPAVLLSGSAIGVYGDRGDEELDETSPPGTGFLAEVCVAWEAAAQPAIDAGIRTSFLRTGIVLSPAGGALKKQLPLFKAFLGGRFGSGRQYQSWISIDDEVGAILHLLSADVPGPVNLTAPQPATNAEFTAALGAVLGRPTKVPVPAFGPRLLLGRELADNLLFSGQRVLPAKLEASGYVFHHPTLDGALRALLGKPAA